MRMHLGMSRIEVPVTVVTVAALSTTLLFAGIGMGPPDVEGVALFARRAQDAANLRHLHQSLASDAADRANSKGAFLLPGLINRLPFEGNEIPGVGEPDETRNNHASLYSAMIARQLISPDVLVSPAESNPVVKVCKDYDWSKYRPANDSYWDDAMRCDLSAGSSVSYATMPIDATRRRTAQWRVSGGSRFALIGTRGPRGGAQSGKVFTDSKTLAQFGTPTDWAGNTCFGDGHVDFGKSMVPERLSPVGSATPPVRDNLFGNESCSLDGDQRNTDCWLVMQVLAAGTREKPDATIDTADGGKYVSWD